MSFFRRFKNKHSASAIGIIGGSDGPTAIFMAKKDKKRKEEQEKFLLHATRQIVPCERTLKELEEYLIEKYQAVPYNLFPHELMNLKVNAILNHYDYVLDRPEPLGEKPTRKEIEAYFEKDTSFQQAREYPAEKLGLEFKAYKLPGDVIVGMEMKSEYLYISNDDGRIIDDLFLYRGVSEKDIQEKSQRFMVYVYTLKRMGKL